MIWIGVIGMSNIFIIYLNTYKAMQGDMKQAVGAPSALSAWSAIVRFPPACHKRAVTSILVWFRPGAAFDLLKPGVSTQRLNV
jgi:hypothetical protein